jgi:hypothetical protein
MSSCGTRGFAAIGISIEQLMLHCGIFLEQLLLHCTEQATDTKGRVRLSQKGTEKKNAESRAVDSADQEHNNLFFRAS